jgi:hypothetical protein
VPLGVLSVKDTIMHTGKRTGVHADGPVQPELASTAQQTRVQLVDPAMIPQSPYLRSNTGHLPSAARSGYHGSEPEDPDLASEAARGRADAHPDKRGGQFLNFTSTTQYDMRKQAEEEEGDFVNRINEEHELAALAAMEAVLFNEEGDSLRAALERSADERIAGRRGVLDGLRPQRRPVTPKALGRPTPAPSPLLPSPEYIRQSPTHYRRRGLPPRQGLSHDVFPPRPASTGDVSFRLPGYELLPAAPFLETVPADSSQSTPECMELARTFVASGKPCRSRKHSL